VTLHDDENNRILDQEIVEKCAKKGLRCMVYAYKDVDIDTWEDLKMRHNDFESEKDRESLEKDMIFVASFGLNDELR
jgi:magnesium-transporting ATPase (P-type)